MVFWLLLSFWSVAAAEEEWARENELDAQKEALKEGRSKENIEADFKEYDMDKNGVLDAADIRARFQKSLEPAMLFQFFVDADSNEDGVITLDEYFTFTTSIDARRK
jgi:Ca2+-binding EF-hand superfamily protein